MPVDPSKKQDYEQSSVVIGAMTNIFCLRIVQFSEKIARVGSPKIQVVIGAMTKR